MVPDDQARCGSGSIDTACRLGSLAVLIVCLLAACGSDIGQSSRPATTRDAGEADEYRVLAEEPRVQGEIGIGVAVDDADYQALWVDTGFAAKPPPVDFAVEVVVVVTSSYGAGCEPSFERLLIEDAEIDVRFFEVESEQVCAADENGHGVGLAINRAVLSYGPSSVRAGESLAELTLE